MNEQEHDNLMQVIAKKYGGQIPTGFDLHLYEPLSYFDVMTCIESEKTFDDFELALTTSIYKKIKAQ